MTREELTVALALAMFLALAAGWGLGALWRRVHQVGAAQDEDHAAMAERLHEAEEARDRDAVHHAAEIARLDGERAHAEADLHRRLAASEADLSLAREQIGALQRDVAGWQRAYEGLTGRDGSHDAPPPAPTRREDGWS